MSAQPVTKATKAHANTRVASSNTRAAPSMGKQASMGASSHQSGVGRLGISQAGPPGNIQAWMGNAWDEAASRSREEDGISIGNQVSGGKPKGNSGAESGLNDDGAQLLVPTGASRHQSRVGYEQSGIRLKSDGALLPVSMENQQDDGAVLPMSMRARLLIHEQAYILNHMHIQTYMYAHACIFEHMRARLVIHEQARQTALHQSTLTSSHPTRARATPASGTGVTAGVTGGGGVLSGAAAGGGAVTAQAQIGFWGDCGGAEKEGGGDDLRSSSGTDLVSMQPSGPQVPRLQSTKPEKASFE